jgi:hypothetical protein
MIGDDTVILETVNLRLALAQQGSKIIGLSPARGLFGNTRDIFQNAHRKRQTRDRMLA